jgi:hypothetical protein
MAARASLADFARTRDLQGADAAVRPVPGESALSDAEDYR